MIRSTEWACALALTALIVFLHAYRAGTAGALWRDEVNTLRCASLPSLLEVWSALCNSTPPFLPYSVMHTWISWLGSGDISLRVLGALEGIGILFALWWNAQLLRYRIPILSLVLFGLSPTAILWQDSPRGYGLALLFLLLACGCVWKVVESPTPGRVALAIVACLLSTQTVFQAVPILFAIVLGGALVCLRKGMWKRTVVVLGIGAMSALSLMPYRLIITGYRDINLVARIHYDFPQIGNVLATTLSSATDYLWWAWIFWAGMGILAGGYLIARRQEDDGREERVNVSIFSLSIVVIGTLSFLVFIKRGNLQLNPWHCVPWMGSMALAVEVLIAQVTTTIPRIVGRLVLALTVAAVAIPIAWAQVGSRGTNLDVVASVLEERASPGDLIVANPWFFGVTLRHYYRGETAWTTVPPLRQAGRVRYELLKDQMARENPLQPVYDAMEKSLSSGKRVWVIGLFRTPPKGELPPFLPPAPNGPGGWYSGYYLNVWTQQLGYFLDSHVRHGERVELPLPGPISPYENATLWEFAGWRP